MGGFPGAQPQVQGHLESQEGHTQYTRTHNIRHTSFAGAWEAPRVPNPEYKGAWKAKKIKNPAYKGKWVAPEIDNPDFKPSHDLYAFKDLKFVGFELWQVGRKDLVCVGGGGVVHACMHALCTLEVCGPGALAGGAGRVWCVWEGCSARMHFVLLKYVGEICVGGGGVVQACMHFVHACMCCGGYALAYASCVSLGPTAMPEQSLLDFQKIFDHSNDYEPWCSMLS